MSLANSINIANYHVYRHVISTKEKYKSLLNIYAHHVLYTSEVEYISDDYIIYNERKR